MVEFCEKHKLKKSEKSGKIVTYRVNVDQLIFFNSLINSLSTTFLDRNSIVKSEIYLLFQRLDRVADIYIFSHQILDSSDGGDYRAVILVSEL